MNKKEIKKWIQECIDDPKYIDRATDIIYQSLNKLALPDLREWFIDNQIPCQIQYDRNCQKRGDQRAHIRMIEVTGMSLKAFDPFFAWSCSYCHSKVESNKEAQDIHIRAMARTFYIAIVGLPIICQGDERRSKSNNGIGGGKR